MANLNKTSLEEQLVTSMDILKTYSLAESKMRKAHVRASFQIKTTDEKIKYAKALKEENLTQNQIASELGVTQPTISNYLKR